MNYTANVEERFRQVQVISWAVEKLEIVRKEILSRYSPSSGKCSQVASALTLIQSLEETPTKEATNSPVSDEVRAGRYMATYCNYKNCIEIFRAGEQWWYRYDGESPCHHYTNGLFKKLEPIE